MAGARQPPVALIVARSRITHVIGRNNTLPWTLRSDLRRFRRLTLGHPVVMGRKTFDSIGRPLPERLNIVVTRRPPGTPPEASHGALRFAPTVGEALRLAAREAAARGAGPVFVIGGAVLYRETLPLAATVYLTEVEAAIAGDATFDEPFGSGEWRLAEEEAVPAGAGDDHAVTFLRYDRIGPPPRSA